MLLARLQDERLAAGQVHDAPLRAVEAPVILECRRVDRLQHVRHQTVVARERAGHDVEVHGGSLSLARTLDRVRNVSCVVTKGSVDFEEGMSIAMSQAPFLHASLSQNTDAAPNVQTGRCAPVGSTPR